jgi:hypothetical protein
LIEVIAMKRSLLLSAAIALALGACATTPPSPDQAKAAANAKPPAGCVGQSATRIPVKDDKSCAGFGSTYTQQDINNTGQSTVGGALPLLDPAITRH